MRRLSIDPLWHTNMYFEGELYRGWWILAVLEDECWVVKCHNPEGEIYITRKAYQPATTAVSAAKKFVDYDIARFALLNVVADWLEGGKIGFEEYWNLLKSIYSVNFRHTIPRNDY